MEAILPPGWSWPGQRVLDFGCGTGKVLCHFADEANEAEFWGCDIDRPSIEWVQRNMCPPFRALECREGASLPRPRAISTSSLHGVCTRTSRIVWPNGCLSTIAFWLTTACCSRHLSVRGWSSISPPKSGVKTVSG